MEADEVGIDLELVQEERLVVLGRTTLLGDLAAQSERARQVRKRVGLAVAPHGEELVLEREEDLLALLELGGLALKQELGEDDAVGDGRVARRYGPGGFRTIRQL